MSKHTPGPWAIRKWTKDTIDEYFDKVVVDDSDNPIAEINWRRNEDDEMPNARLIAAAPDLLEALEYCIKQIPEFATVPGIASAIAKAKGE